VGGLLGGWYAHALSECEGGLTAARNIEEHEDTKATKKNTREENIKLVAAN
jgi:hypothetical protein